MIKYFFLCLIFLAFNAWPKVSMDLHFSRAEIEQGNIEPVKLLLETDGVQKVQLQKLKGQTLGDSLYVYEVFPLMKREGGAGFEADAKVIFIKVPEGRTVTHKLPQDELVISLGNASIKPTEAPQELIYENFSIPSRPKIILWISILLGLGLLAYFGHKFYFSQKKKKILREKRLKLKSDLYNGTQYSEVVSIWQKREVFLKEFPHIEEAFRKFEITLFKYQFKPTQSEVEKSLVVEAYRSFLQEIMGGFNGV